MPEKLDSKRSSMSTGPQIVASELAMDSSSALSDNSRYDPGRRSNSATGTTMGPLRPELRHSVLEDINLTVTLFGYVLIEKPVVLCYGFGFALVLLHQIA